MTVRLSHRLLRNRRRQSRRRQSFSQIETLECRQMLSADFSAAFALPNMLTVETDSYDASSILVRFDTDVFDVQASHFDYTSTAGVTVTDTGVDFGLVPGMHEFALPEGFSVTDAIAAFQQDANVLYASPNYHIQLTVMPDDPQFDSLWGMDNTGQTGGTTDADIDALEAWDITTGTGATIIAVIDTGIDYTHEDLAANIWVNPGEIAGDGIDNDGNGYIDDIHGYDFANNDGDPMDDNNHGTHVAGTIGAVGDNGIGVAGVNWNATIMPVKFIDAGGGGSMSDAIAAINYAVDNGASISNNSWGFNGGFSQPLFDVIEYAQQAGHIFVAAAGNGDFFGNGLDNDVNPFFPANTELDNVVAVAATDHNDEIATFSNYGATTVDVGAPGVGILSTTIGNTYSTFNGTSMATPHVVGLLSLIMDQNPEWSYQQVIGRLYETVDPIAALDGITTTGGRINAAAALGPDITGPYVIGSNPANFLFDPFNSVRVTFNEAIDPGTFRKSDIVSFNGPNGSINVTRVDSVAGSNDREFDVIFSTQSELGDYTLILGPNLTDVAGNLMDQDRDGNGGESVQDRHTIAFSLAPFFANFDFGTGASPVAAGYQEVDASTSYTAGKGFGWSAGTIDSRDRGAFYGDALARDFNFTELGTFLVDVPDAAAIYEVTITMGDGLAARDEMGVFVEGILIDSVDSALGQYATRTFQATVADGQLTLLLDDLGGIDPNVMINSLQITALGPDTFGSKVVAVNPDGTATDQLDRITLTFDEAIDAQSFTTADVVNLSGPNGAITPTAVNQLTATTYEVVFATQTQQGDYTLTIGPGISDVAGNLMNQDDDGVNGENPQDQFTATVTLIPTPPLELHFDFGSTFSPVADGYTGVAQSTAYNTTLGYGWLSGAIDSRDRGAFYGDELQRDFNFSQSATFVVDVAESAIYEVTLTMGDGLAQRDDMGVSLEGLQVDSVTSLYGQYVTSTYQVTVTDGQLTLDLVDLGGSDTLVVINALDIRSLGPDTVGPQVVSTDPSSEASGVLDRIVVSFNEGMDASSFTVDDVIALTGPNGVITPTAVNQLSPASFEVTFTPQTTLGDYTLTIGPDINDSSGNLMDQDGDAIGGELIEDRYSTTITLAPIPLLEWHFDFGTTSSPVADGYTRVAHNTTYSAANGFGWLSGSIDSRDRGAFYGSQLTSDFNFTALGTFVVDVSSAPGIYDITLTMGDGIAVRDEMGVILEGVQVDSVTTAWGQYATNTYRVSVADGQLTLLLDDLGGSNSIVMINGLDVVEVGPDDRGPQVISIDPPVEASSPLDHITVTFDEAVDAETFTTADVVILSGPEGPITPTAVNQLSANVFEIVFSAQSAAGDYSLSIGPEIADLAGNLMNQDGDTVNGETSEDQYSATITLTGAALFEQHFDFGTAFSPVETGYTSVLYNTTYNASRRFGWVSGYIDSRDRGAFYGDELTRDFNFTGLGTFVVDVSATPAEYDVTVTLGDGLAVRDQMGVFLEGTLVDSVTTAWGQYATNTYRVSVADGQLTLLLDDLGGIAIVMINGLSVVEVGPGTASVAGVASNDMAALSTARRSERGGGSTKVRAPIQAGAFTSALPAPHSAFEIAQPEFPVFSLSTELITDRDAAFVPSVDVAATSPTIWSLESEDGSTEREEMTNNDTLRSALPAPRSAFDTDQLDLLFAGATITDGSLNDDLIGRLLLS